MNPWVKRLLVVATAVGAYITAGGDLSFESLLKVAAGALVGALTPQFAAGKEKSDV